MQSVFSHVPLAQKAYRRKLWLQSEANYLNIAKDKDYPSWLYRLGETLFPMKLHTLHWVDGLPCLRCPHDPLHYLIRSLALKPLPP